VIDKVTRFMVKGSPPYKPYVQGLAPRLLKKNRQQKKHLTVLKTFDAFVVWKKKIDRKKFLRTPFC